MFWSSYVSNLALHMGTKVTSRVAVALHNLTQPSLLLARCIRPSAGMAPVHMLALCRMTAMIEVPRRQPCSCDRVHIYIIPLTHHIDFRLVALTVETCKHRR